MRPDIGRYLDNRLHEVMLLIKVVYDVCTGEGADVSAWVDGRELVFGRKGEREGPGFLRLLPHEVNVTIAFPRGHDIPDPLKRARGVPGSRTRMTLRTTADLDVYVRRMIDTAYALDAS